MPEPIKGNLNFEVCHNTYPATHTMKSMMACQDYHEIGMTLTGDRNIIMEDRIFTLHPGVVATTPMGAYHRSSSASDVPYERIMIKYKPVMVTEFISLIGKEAFDEINYGYIHTFSDEYREKIYNLLFEMKEVYENYNPFSELLFKGLLHRLLYLIYTHRLPADSKHCLLFNSTNPLIVEALCYMENHFLLSPSLADVATHVNVSREHLSREFKKTVGISFSDYQNGIRLRHAKELLKNTDLSIDKISELSGFSNSNYMCDIFKKYLSISPSGFRKKFRAEQTNNSHIKKIAR